MKRAGMIMDLTASDVYWNDYIKYVSDRKKLEYKSSVFKDNLGKSTLSFRARPHREQLLENAVTSLKQDRTSS